ncbi:LysM peptidoglycan-binding domain-containing protein [Brachyspira hampsonii]|uniref:LysM peptidoglycan-binding domain-containing protein n=1 Tax=Brachyspira hampsonii TaxID=1287055 RepID=UPI000D3C8AAA|nr:LysM peptidoglycan-binding domain-containing protein [Brachyspira hampsonii]
MMKIKKIMATIALLSFTWSVLPAQTYEDAARITQEADDLQNQGQYQQSYDKSQEASVSIDKASMALFYRLMNARINKTKNDADNAITEINQMGAARDNQFKAQYEEAVKYFEEGNANIGSIPGPDTVAQNDEEFNTASNTFNTVLQYYNNALSSANSVKEGYLGRERDTASKSIADARSKYNAALGKSIKAGDNNDKTVSGALTKADEALKSDNFASVQQNVAAALAGITKAEADAKAAAERAAAAAKAKAEAEAKAKAAAEAKAKAEAEAKAKAAAEAKAKAEAEAKAKAEAEAKRKAEEEARQKAEQEALAKEQADAVAKAKQDIANAQQKYDSLVNDSTITRGDETDQNISTLLADANNVVETDPAAASQKALEASKAMDDLVNNRDNAIAREENQRQLDELKARYQQLIDEGYIIPDSEEDQNLSQIIKDAEDALANNDNTLAREKLEEANRSMNAIYEMGPKRPVDGDLVDTDNNNNETGQIIDATTGQTVNTEGKVTVLPMYYTVVQRTPLTDALWRIAGYSFIYNDPIQWYRLYQANRNVLRDPNNPDLILPGQVLTIPSMNGEERAGTYDPNMEYITYDEAMILRNQQQNNNTENANTEETTEAAQTAE